MNQFPAVSVKDIVDDVIFNTESSKIFLFCFVYNLLPVSEAFSLQRNVPSAPVSLNGIFIFSYPPYAGYSRPSISMNTRKGFKGVLAL